MSATNDGGPAFPCERGEILWRNSKGEVTKSRPDEFAPHKGMTLRDYFAAKAMAAMLSNPANYGSGGEWKDEHATVSEQAYEIADDMIQHRDL